MEQLREAEILIGDLEILSKDVDPELLAELLGFHGVPVETI